MWVSVSLRRCLFVVLVAMAGLACDDGGSSSGSGPQCSAPGDPGCSCLAGGLCNSSVWGQLVCEAGICQVPGCRVGQQWCPCGAQGACQGELVCRDVGGQQACAPGCQDGDPGCACLAGHECSPSWTGGAQVCSMGRCRPEPCESGTLRCGCDEQGACVDDHLCIQGRCVEDTGQTLLPPAEPRCYTPCRGSDVVLGDGTRSVCSDDGLLEGCIGDSVCVGGTCLVASTVALQLQEVGDGAGSCGTDADCPDHQNCIQGACYSDCDQDADCRGGRRCYRHACRIPCARGEGQTPCPDGTRCDSQNSVMGHCLPLAPGWVAAEAAIAQPSPVACPGGASPVAAPLLKFTASRQRRRFTVTNCTSALRVFTIDTPDEELQRWVAGEDGVPSLDWLKMAVVGEDGPGGGSLTLSLEPAEVAHVEVDASGGPNDEAWDLALDVSSAGMRTTEVHLVYTPNPQGQWAGKVYYLANFGTGHLDEWRAALAEGDEEADGEISQVGNALVRRWWGYRTGQLSYSEFRAMLTSTRTESWRWPASREFCGNDRAVCYPSDNLVGFSVFSDDIESSPVPTGVSELGIVLNLRGSEEDPARWEGKVDSQQVLQHPGSPPVSLEFAGDPAECHGQQEGSCLTLVRSFETQMLVGGRYPEPEGGCLASEFEPVELPWLLPGFDAEALVEAADGRRYSRECRFAHAPYSSGGEEGEGEGADPATMALNVSLAGANPIPNGRAVRSTVTLVDGALIDGEDLFLIFEQRLPALFDDGAARAYGFMLLRRVDVPLAEQDLVAAATPEEVPLPPATPSPTCAPWLVRDVFGAGMPDDLDEVLDPVNAQRLARFALDGHTNDAMPAALPNVDARESVHYLCHMDGYFDGGSAGSHPCPPGSDVTFFAIRLELGQAVDLPSSRWTGALDCNDRDGYCRPDEPCAATHTTIQCSLEQGDAVGACAETGGCVDPDAPCRFKGDCGPTLESWLAEWRSLDEHARVNHFFRPHPAWRCDDVDVATCDRDRTDLRVGKTFYAVADEGAYSMAPLPQAIHEAFRYKTQFASRLTGATVGFSPRICKGEAYPYCYDPEAIDEIRDRVSCLGYLFTHHYDSLDAPPGPSDPEPLRARVSRVLQRSFAYEELIEPHRPTPTVLFGFEAMHAELLVMLGDESYTSAFASRFDLAEQMVASFEGSAFEPDGLDLAGGAGYEMHSLYQATQYYQRALDRLFELTDTIARSQEPGFRGPQMLGPEASVSWLKRLIRASSQKARAWAEISRRYHAFGRPAPARRVVEKAYVAAYLESIYLSQLMKRVLDRATGAQKAQVEAEIELAQLTYKDALLDMATVHRSITDQVTHFGFSETYVPFPALDPGDPNAFEKLLDRTRAKLEVAADKEASALEDRREFDSDAAAFQSELASIGLDFDAQLGEICGTFRVRSAGGDDIVYPATREYADLAPDRLRVAGDPCGLVGNGSIHEAMGELELARLAMEQWRLRYRNVMQSARDEELRIDEQCKRINSFADYVAGTGATKVTFSTLANAAQGLLNTLDRTWGVCAEVLDKADCIVGTATDCPTKLPIGGLLVVGGAAYIGGTGILEAGIVAAQLAIETIEVAETVREAREPCDEARIDGRFVVREKMRELAELNLEGLQLAYETQLVLSRLDGLRNDALGAMATQEEQLRQTIDVEAARTDPNVRIFRNNAIIQADRTFQAALREAYRLTLMFEYYTSQSFAPRSSLPLVRMVAHGDNPLQAYVDELEDAFYDFEESYGSPDLRVDVISVRDDVLQVPEQHAGQALTPQKRFLAFQERLQSVPRDGRGALLIDFMTSLERLSPLTHNHKVRFVEVELVGRDLGDEFGRVYVRQKADGIGFLRDVDGGKLTYSLPQRTAVVDVSFNGERPVSEVLGLFEGSVWDYYRSERLRDRPLHHSGWQLIFDLQSEHVNRDIELSGLEDIRIYLWYTDFTEL